ncbi:YggT family protein [Actinoplanes sp. NPDC051859]|uniref:YggT family protein n=1 Tax=Actinoplanes sp. NPDC051859 TaxID=3363909 RepID=UPI0037A511BC
MGSLLTVVSLLLLLVQVLLIARAILDWTVVLAGPSMPGSARSRLTAGVHAVTEPILAPVRRILPPLRFGGVGIDLAFIVVFLSIIVIRWFLPY